MDQIMSQQCRQRKLETNLKVKVLVFLVVPHNLIKEGCGCSNTHKITQRMRPTFDREVKSLFGKYFRSVSKKKHSKTYFLIS